MPPKLDEMSGTVRINVVTSEAWVEKVDAWRAEQRPIPSRAQAIRALVNMGIGAHQEWKRRREAEGD